MNPIATVFRRELKGYFATPVAYVFIVIFLILAGSLTFYFGGFYERGQADLSAFFIYHPWLYLFLVPAIAMRLWAEERKSGTIELLLTLPITMFQAVLAKFLAAWAFVGSFLMAGAFLAIGSCLSAATRNQVVAFILTVVACFLLLLAGFPLVLGFFQTILPQGVVDAISGLSLYAHFDAISKGVLDLRDIVYFVLTIGAWLYATAIVIDLKKAD